MATFPPSGFTIDAMICDSVATESGKLYVQGGGWNLLTSTTFPFRHPRLAIACIVGTPYHETNKAHVVEFVLEHEDGERMRLGEHNSIRAQFTLGRPPQLTPGDPQNVPLGINLDQLEFVRPGAFSFVISVNGTEVERLPFRIIDPQSIIATGGTGG